MYNELDPLLHSQLRLGIVSLLVSTKEAEFVFIKEQTGSTAGNLSVQVEKLLQAEYITVEKTFRGKKPLTICRIAPNGLEAFEKYVNDLQQYIAVSKK